MYQYIRRETVRLLETCAPCAFKVGITDGVRWRFVNRSYGYYWIDYNKIFALTIVSAADARALEADLIAFFKGRDMGLGIKCANVALGGDGVGDTNPKPHFVYVAVSQAALRALAF
jgi:hypothetical protein